MPFALALISVPFDLDQHRKAMGAAPEALRAAGLSERLAARGLNVARESILDDGLGAGDVRARLGRLQARVADRVADAVRSGLTPVVIGGDCCNAIGAWSGYTRACPGETPGVLWFDAHGDWNTEETSRSGYPGGMPYAAICGRGSADLRTAAGITRPALAASCALVGVRDLDPLEAAALDATAIAQLTPEQARSGCDPAAHALADVGSIFLHFDTDVLDTAFMPGVRFPAPGGFSPAEAVHLAHSLRNGRPLASLTLASVEPDRDPSGLSVETGLQVLLDLLAP